MGPAREGPLSRQGHNSTYAAKIRRSPKHGRLPSRCRPWAIGPRAGDRFELLRRSKDLVVDIRQGYFCHYFCQLDAATGWPKHTLKHGTGPLPDSICKIDETAERGISLRQLLVTYE